MTNVVSTDRGHVVEHKCELDGRMKGITVVALEMKELGEWRYRLRVPSDAEARVTCASHAHIQETRNHRATGFYQADRGWVASIRKIDSNLKVDMAIANSDDFVLKVPANVDYIIKMSGPVVYAYMTNDKVASKPKKDEFYEQVSRLSDEDVFKIYAKQVGLTLEAILERVEKSFKPYSG